MQRAQREDAGQLDLELDVAVLVEIPEEAVLVVLDRRDRRDDQPARAAHLRVVGQPAVGVLPEDAEVFLVHADGVLDRQRLAAAVAQVGVEVADQAEAVAAELQAVGAHAHAVLADVEGVLAAPASGAGRRRGRPSR